MAYFSSVIYFCLCLTLVVAAIPVEKEECECPGPLAHYKALNCTPDKHTQDCCAWRYDCNHLYDRIEKRNKTCYLNGREYEIGKSITRFELNMCTQLCVCSVMDGLADFNCTRLSCFTSSGDGRLRRNSPEQLTPSPNKGIFSFVPEIKEVTAVCKENGITLSLGETTVLRQPLMKLCTCERKETGTYGFSCKELINDLDIHAAAGFYNNCAPVYHTASGEKTIGTQRKTWRCQTTNDYVIPIIHPANYTPNVSKGESVIIPTSGHGPLSAVHCPSVQNTQFVFTQSVLKQCKFVNPGGDMNITFDMTYTHLCRFGQMTMHIGDRLNSIRYDNDHCIVCTCQVPPVPTCIWKVHASCTEIARKDRRLTRRLNKDGALPQKNCSKITSYYIAPTICYKNKPYITHAICSLFKCVVDPVYIED